MLYICTKCGYGYISKGFISWTPIGSKPKQVDWLFRSYYDALLPEVSYPSSGQLVASVDGISTSKCRSLRDNLRHSVGD